MNATTEGAATLFPSFAVAARSLILLACHLPAGAADLTFYGYSDCHFETEYTTGQEMTRRINDLPGTAYPPAIGGVVAVPRGILMAGDLVDDGALAALYPGQWANYLADYGVNGEGRVKFPVYEGIGNHDVNENMFMFGQVKARNQKRRDLGLIGDVSSNGYHYSWDWDGIHFVNLNLFPGNIWHGGADAYGPNHHPQYALDFLKEDLRKHVGNSGRPVITMHHFRPIDENWWTMTAADEYQKALQDYNVILISTGHQGGGVANTWRGISWATSNSTLDVYRISSDNKLTILERGPSSWGQAFQKDIFRSWASSGLPAVVNNGAWASNLTATGATLSAKLVHALTAMTQVTVYWDTVDRGPTTAGWRNSRSLGVMGAGEALTTEVSGLAPFTTYYYRARATSPEGEAWAASAVSFTTKGVLPAGWREGFIGYAQRAGTGAQHAGGVFTVVGSGRDIAEPGQRIDNFEYVSQDLAGDGEIIARVAAMSAGNRDPKAGVMIRESLDDSARNVAVLVSPVSGVRLTGRSGPGVYLPSGPANAFRAPYWIRLARKGSVFTGSLSADGKAWTDIGMPVTLAMSGRVHIGLAVTAGNRDGSRLHAATFDNVALKGTPVRIAAPIPGSGDRWIELPGMAAGFRVPGRIGSIRLARIFTSGGELVSEIPLPLTASAARPAAAGPGRTLRGVLLVEFIGSEGTHQARSVGR